MKMDNIRWETFEQEDDYLIEQECALCGHRWQVELGDDNGEDNCPKCGNDEILNETSHEGRRCGSCNHEFDIWEDGYTVKDKTDEYYLICETCAEENKEIKDRIK